MLYMEHTDYQNITVAQSPGLSQEEAIMAKKQETNAEKLKRINEEKRKLAEEAKALRAEQDAGKAERIAARKIQAQARKDVRIHKSALSGATATIFASFSEGDSEALNKLADSIMEHATTLAGAVRSFANADQTAASQEEDSEPEGEDEDL